jgi:hypothetical protein
MTLSYRLFFVMSLAFIHSACSGGDGSDTGGSTQPLSVTISGAGTVLSAPDGLSVCTTAPCSAPFKAGSSVNLTAVASSGNTFTGWSGACSGPSATCTVAMDAAKSAVANFSPIAACSLDGATTLASTITDAAGKLATNNTPNRLCPKATWGQVTGICHGDYAVQVNAYGTPPANTNFAMWSQNSGCWGVRVTEPANPKFVYWNAPIVTRGFSFGYSAPLTPAGGIPVSSLNAQYANAKTPCPAQGKSDSVCVKWSMEVPGISSKSAVNTAKSTLTNWDAMIDVYFHAVPNPAPGNSATFDLQIYQMLMDWQAGNGPNWATNMLRRYSTKTIGGVKYLVTVNTQNPGTEGSNWVGFGGKLNVVSLFALPTLPTTKTEGGAGSYLWGTPSALHDVGGIIAWLSQTQTISGVTSIFDDAGKPLFDNARGSTVAEPLISPAYYLTGLNTGFEVIQANATDPNHVNNAEYKTTNYWVALPGESVGK